MVPTAAQVVAQPQVVSWKTEPWMATSHSSDAVLSNYSINLHEDGLDAKCESTLR